MELEQKIESYLVNNSMAAVLTMLGEICYRRAAQQEDRGAARNWERLGNRIEVARQEAQEEML